MEEFTVPQPLSIASPLTSRKRQKSSKQEAAGRIKAKAKSISGRKPSKLVEKQASRRHQALEKEFSKAQKQARAKTEQTDEVPFDLPLGSSSSAQAIWFPEGNPPLGQINSK